MAINTYNYTTAVTFMISLLSIIINMYVYFVPVFIGIWFALRFVTAESVWVRRSVRLIIWIFWSKKCFLQHRFVIRAICAHDYSEDCDDKMWPEDEEKMCFHFVGAVWKLIVTYFIRKAISWELIQIESG